MSSDPPEHRPESRNKPRSGESSGCFGLVIEVGTWVLSIFAITVGAFLLVFGVLDFSPEARLGTLVLLVLVPVAVYALLRIARNILNELRGDDQDE
ncbi:hypothetical protein [Rubrobacter indicoceani]|uniref:hypothetical protein n=1 Tax=Rubrobacter indicoceani TaxID=2051957 RepID=UPI0013C41B45|nr:hypothetical protein [Rubrobacter indicoceani]